MSQKGLVEHNKVDIPTIHEHIWNILEDSELGESTIGEFLIVQNEGVRRIEWWVKHYIFKFNVYQPFGGIS
jgi:hypothetical protein